MILNTGQRTDIPAFYAPWLVHRLRAGEVCVRNPYDIHQVTRYRLDPRVVDLIGFCTKNPAPMLPYMDLLAPFGQFWYVTITPYGRDIEPNVPPWEEVVRSFHQLSYVLGTRAVGWRYDPIILDAHHTLAWHDVRRDGRAAGRPDGDGRHQLPHALCQDAPQLSRGT